MFTEGKGKYVLYKNISKLSAEKRSELYAQMTKQNTSSSFQNLIGMPPFYFGGHFHFFHDTDSLRQGLPEELWDIEFIVLQYKGAIAVVKSNSRTFMDLFHKITECYNKFYEKYQHEMEKRGLYLLSNGFKGFKRSGNSLFLIMKIEKD